MKKYCLTESTEEVDGKTVYQIQALIDIPSIDIKKGDLGGYVEGEHNLSHEGDAWIYDTALVMDNAKVYGSAQVRYSKLTDNAEIFDNVRIVYESETESELEYTQVWVGEDAKIYGDVMLRNNRRLHILGNTKVYGRTIFCNNIEINISRNVEIFDVNFSDNVKVDVFDNAKVLDSILAYNHYIDIYESAVIKSSRIQFNQYLYIKGSAYINGLVSNSCNLSLGDYLKIYGKICGTPKLEGKVYIGQDTLIDDSLIVSGNGRLNGSMLKIDRIYLPDNADIDSNGAVFFVNYISDLSRSITVYHNQNNGLSVGFIINSTDYDNKRYFATLDEFREFLQENANQDEIEDINLILKIAEKRILNRKLPMVIENIES
ncbi:MULTISPECIES: hypothetical protein [Mannheimia]|uniref:Polymer-forming cytoskeletal n=1 Tax=Mannheimia pernigra TaxID=111844 RepID=A0ABD7A8W4_9PAST|nr:MULTISPECIES: hypothetical protein [Mannheimia]QLB42458.1 hypothetical protein HV560_06345 [Mannheimia pernigra]QTM00312.1 hypothetical protein GM698_01090 [Mannheimia sp. ZY171111]